MNINDLATYEILESGNQIFGGAKTIVKGNADAKRGKADAYVVAAGLGRSNSAKTKTNTKASPDSAFATYGGSAVSKTGLEYSKSYDYGYDYDY